MAKGDAEIVQNLIKSGTEVNALGMLVFRLKDYSECMTPELLKISPKKFTETGNPLKIALLGFDDTYHPCFGVKDQPNLKIISALLTAGANPNLISDPLQIAPLVVILENDKIDKETRDKIVLMLLQAGVDPNSRDYETNQTSLEIALEHSYYNIIKYLLDYGANLFPSGSIPQFNMPVPDITRVFFQADETARQIVLNHPYNKLLFKALEDKNYQTLVRLITQPHLKLPNFNINALNENGYTTLMVAVDNDLPFIEFLLRWGANPNITSNDGKTALSIAQEKDNAKIAELLKKYGALR